LLIGFCPIGILESAMYIKEITIAGYWMMAFDPAVTTACYTAI